ncbi:MAG: (deoxy)nucleoside triphosphate pyrophosphohydrolase [Armatimonadetes bacterium]|nr:(deoxy)nucleoside triphosphate pyrophosphohydrolase [Armatimonadota bacterium]
MATGGDRPILRIGLAIIRQGEALLVTRRPAGSHLEGYWEFPGGKQQAGETVEGCAVREAWEEVGVECGAVHCYPPIRFDYPDRSVELHPVECRFLGGEPQALEAAEWRWVRPEELSTLSFPPANAPLLEQLQRTSAPE